MIREKGTANGSLDAEDIFRSTRELASRDIIRNRAAGRA